MKFNTSMPKGLQLHYLNELELARVSFEKQHFQVSWRHYERAHIISQPYPLQHTTVHWKMLLFGIKTKNGKEVFGQIPRLLIGGIKSFVNNVPVGNTGGANVPPLRPMEIPDDLQKIISLYKN